MEIINTTKSIKSHFVRYKKEPNKQTKKPEKKICLVRLKEIFITFYSRVQHLACGLLSCYLTSESSLSTSPEGKCQKILYLEFYALWYIIGGLLILLLG